MTPPPMGLFTHSASMSHTRLVPGQGGGQTIPHRLVTTFHVLPSQVAVPPQHLATGHMRPGEVHGSPSLGDSTGQEPAPPVPELLELPVEAALEVDAAEVDEDAAEVDEDAAEVDEDAEAEVPLEEAAPPAPPEVLTATLPPQAAAAAASRMHET
jgi:hypothetical protein